MAKEKVNYQEVYDLYQLCSETKDLREFCADYGVNYDKFMNWQRHQLWSEKLGKTVQVDQPKVALTSSTCHPKFICEQWSDTLMPFHKHSLIDSLLALRQCNLYSHYSFSKFEHLVHTHIYAG